MDEIKEAGEQQSGAVGQLRVPGRRIRSKLLGAFILLIAFTLVGITVALVARKYTQQNIDELVKVHGRIARLSLDTENKLRLMELNEKNFLLEYGKIGVQEAKNKYLQPFLDRGGDVYQTLYEIQQLAPSSQDIEAAQTAMVSVNEYLTAFVGTVNIIELRVDKEFGALTKLQNAIDNLEKTVSRVEDRPVAVQFYQLRDAYLQYLNVSDQESKSVRVSRQKFVETVEAAKTLSDEVRSTLLAQIEDFTRWFREIRETDGVIAARILGYQDAARRAEPVIKSFLDYAVANEERAIKQIEETGIMVQRVLFGTGALTVLFALFIAVRLSRGINDQVNRIMVLFDRINQGDYSARAEVISNDELGVMASTLNELLDNTTMLIQSQEERDSIQESIMSLLEEISAFTDGDFTARARVTEDMTGAIADSFNAMADQFSEIIAKVKEATEAVDITSDEVARKTTGLAEKNILQVKEVTGAVDQVSKMVASIRAVAENAEQSALVSQESRSRALEGATAVDQTSEAMAEIREQINETARSIKRLGESSLEIGNIVKIIDDIADRTSILALNASIQAAMAGEAGHGFAVVADEVQRLADSSSNSTKQIEILIKSIQTEVTDLTSRIDESIGKVVQGSKLADDAHAKLQEIGSISSRLAELIEAITGATMNQVEMSEHISRSMQEVGEVSRESSLSSQDTAASMTALSETARTLRAEVDIFRVGELETA